MCGISHLAPAAKADGHARHGKPVHEVGRAIHGVDYPRRGIGESRDRPGIGARLLQIGPVHAVQQYACNVFRFSTTHHCSSYAGATYAMIVTPRHSVSRYIYYYLLLLLLYASYCGLCRRRSWTLAGAINSMKIQSASTIHQRHFHQ